MRRRAAFLDRDGVLNRAVVKNGKSYPPPDAGALELFPGVSEAVAALRAAGYLCICVTNQPDLARGTRSGENVAAMNAKVMALAGLDDLRMCPHDDSDHCPCRKPKPGLLLAAAEEWGVSLPESWMIGDRDSDVAAGRAGGCRTIRIGSESGDAGPDAVFPSLSAAVLWLLDPRRESASTQ